MRRLEPDERRSLEDNIYVTMVELDGATDPEIVRSLNSRLTGLIKNYHVGTDVEFCEDPHYWIKRFGRN